MLSLKNYLSYFGFDIFMLKYLLYSNTLRLDASSDTLILKNDIKF